jgi:hypothetical protein
MMRQVVGREAGEPRSQPRGIIARVDADRCMAPVIESYNAQRDANAQRALLVQHGCPVSIAGTGP